MNTAASVLLRIFLVGIVFSSLTTAGLMAAGWAPAPGVIPTPGPFIPPAHLVEGKDYSNNQDTDHNALLDNEQNIAWDGFGGTRNAQDYEGSRFAYPTVNQPLQVDGIANAGDALYREVIADNAALVFSVGGNAYIPTQVADSRIFAEPIAAAGGAGAAFVWATPPIIDRLGVPELDGLELWGVNNLDDSDRYSLYRDPQIPLAGAAEKVAIWAYDTGTHTSNPHTLTTDLAAAMDLQFFAIGAGGPLWSQLVERMDVDAIMVFGSEVLFSIVPLNLSTAIPGFVGFDGGEIFVYTPGSATTFLRHGGHDWNTAFDVMGTFGVPSENIDAIEAVAGIPEPSSVVLAAFGVLGLTGYGWRRRRASSR